MGNGRRRDEEADGHSSSRKLRKIGNTEALGPGPGVIYLEAVVTRGMRCLNILEWVVLV